VRASPPSPAAPRPQLGVKVEAKLVAWMRELNCKDMPSGRVQVMAKTWELADALQIGLGIHPLPRGHHARL
jgi:hypothetical protein